MELDTLARIAATYSLIIWLGGLLHLAVAAMPQVRMVEDRRMRIFLTVGMMRRYNPPSWAALSILLISTLYLSLSLWTGLLSVLALALVMVVFIMDFTHSFVYGPRAAKGDIHARKIANILAVSEIPPALALPTILTLL
ncbi:MAG: hypothetical protein QXI97_03050 [Nitrososphaerota archaeon]